MPIKRVVVNRVLRIIFMEKGFVDKMGMLSNLALGEIVYWGISG